MFTFMGHFIQKFGYGNAAIEIGKELAWLEPSVKLLDMAIPDEADASTFGEIGGECWDVDGTALVMAIPLWYPFVHARRLAAFTMCESTQIPREFIPPIEEHARLVIVPCEHCRKVYERMTDKPVRVAPLGIDPGEYQPMYRGQRDQPYTFLWSGTPDLRKGYDLAYGGFYRAFGHRMDVKLIMHFREFPLGLKGCTDPNVELIEGMISQERWLALLKQADCFLYPARGEGWGLPPREAAATGLPAIVTNWGGLSDQIDRWALPVRVSHLVPATFGPWDTGEIGEWAEPDVTHLVARMQWCVEHKREAAEMGMAASKWLQTYQTWTHSAQAVLHIMEEL
ncbi:MAG: glycosyltransferase family 4 protein [Anaerolineae bacterium]|nr:glycosyltransferase family 4 protein [Anaerolineae bacterium]